MVAEIVAPTIASTLMRKSPWIPLFVGLGVVSLGSWAVIFIPETLPRKQSNVLLEAGDMIDNEAASTDSTARLLPTKSSLFVKLNGNLSSELRSLRTHITIPILLLLPGFLIEPLPRQMVDLVLRYISKRFHWPLAEAGILLSVRAFINLILLLAILPLISHILISPKSLSHSYHRLRSCNFSFRFNYTTSQKDLLLARASLLFMILGATLLALSAFPSAPHYDPPHDNNLPITLAILGLIIYTLGMGFHSFIRSLVTSLVDDMHVARLYSVISVIQTLGGFGTAAMLTGLYAQALRLAEDGDSHADGGNKLGWLGLPFWGIVITGWVVGTGVTLFRVQQVHKQARVGAEDEDEGTLGDGGAST